MAAVDSWRADAWDPEWDLPFPSFDDVPDTATRRRPIELSPGVWIYPEFLDRLEKASRDPYGPAAAWKLDEF